MFFQFVAEISDLVVAAVPNLQARQIEAVFDSGDPNVVFSMCARFDGPERLSAWRVTAPSKAVQSLQWLPLNAAFV